MTLEDYQADLRRSYVGGGPGAVVSGVVWAVAAVVFSQSGLQAGFAALFFGGMVIFPVSMLVSRTLFARAGVMAGNPGGRIVVETLPMMFVGLFVAWLLMANRPDLVFPIAAMAVGAHYFNFRTAYGDVTYYILGGLMVAVGALAAMGLGLTSLHTIALIAAIEIAFGLYLTFANRKNR
jgi:hypothetical protein